MPFRNCGDVHLPDVIPRSSPPHVVRHRTYQELRKDRTSVIICPKIVWCTDWFWGFVIIAASGDEGVQQTKRLLHEGVGGRVRSRFEAENSFMRETFRGRPMADVFQGNLHRPIDEGSPL
jgi:hypothetical protein